MYSLKRILVCLDLSEVDDQLMKASASMARLSGRQFFFLHVVKSMELPKDVKKKYGYMLAPVEDNVKTIIEDKLKRYFVNRGESEYEVEVVQGHVSDVILKYSEAKKVDLIVMGKKLIHHGSGAHPERIVKHCHCSFLLIPQNSYHGLKRMMVPVDFSENSRMALEQAMVISESSGASIVCQHSYKVPSGYHTTGKNYEQFAHAIHDAAVDEKMDLIVMGSKGRTSLASMFLGSVATKTVIYDLEVELMVVKNKKQNMSLLQAIRNI
jgi:nucleotide-binding universal stress UspA family protein